MKQGWLNQTEYPFTPHYLNIGEHQLHYIDEGEGDTILFVHGTPSWSFDYRHIIKELRPSYRCIAFDHIGFGLSSKPAEYDYSTPNHSLTLQKLITHLQLENFTLVVHDFGGPIGLNYATLFPQKINKLVIFNSWMWSSQHEPEFIQLSKMLKSPLLPFLYRYFNFSARFILPRSFGNRKLSKKILRQYTQPFAGINHRNGPLAFAQSLLNDQDWFEQIWERKQNIATIPTLCIWGLKDPIIKPHHLSKFKKGLNVIETLELNNCGHFPQEEEPEKVVGVMRRFLGG